MNHFREMGTFVFFFFLIWPDCLYYLKFPCLPSSENKDMKDCEGGSWHHPENMTVCLLRTAISGR